MRLCFDPTICSDALIADAITTAKNAGFDAMILHCAKTASSPFHPKASVRVIRDYFDKANIALVGLNIRDLTGLNDKGIENLDFSLRQIEWDIHLARALRLQSANFKGGPNTNNARDALITGVNKILETISDVTLNIGNSQNTCLVNTDDYKTIMSQLPNRAKLWLDATEMNDATDSVDSFLDRIGHVTINLENLDIVQALKKNRYQGTLAIDLQNTAGDPVKVASHARKQIKEILDANE